MVPEEVDFEKLKILPPTAVLQELIKLAFKDQVGVMTELLISGGENERWAQQDDIKTALYKQVAPILHKFDYIFLITVFRDAAKVFIKNGRPALWPWVNMQWRDWCAQHQGEEAERLKTPVMSDDQLAELEQAVANGAS